MNDLFVEFTYIFEENSECKLKSVWRGFSHLLTNTFQQTMSNAVEYDSPNEGRRGIDQ